MKICFKHPQSNATYYAQLGFDWGAFFSLGLIGLPFILRKMKMLGLFSIGVNIVVAIAMNNKAVSDEESFLWLGLIIGLSIYLGIKGGKLTARSYLEKGYLMQSSDDALVKKAKAVWEIE